MSQKKALLLQRRQELLDLRCIIEVRREERLVLDSIRHIITELRIGDCSTSDPTEQLQTIGYVVYIKSKHACAYHTLEELLTPCSELTAPFLRSKRSELSTPILGQDLTRAKALLSSCIRSSEHYKIFTNVA